MANLFLPTSSPSRQNQNGFRNNSFHFERKILIASLPSSNGVGVDISQLVTNVRINYTLSLASEISFDVIDPGLRMSKANYFILGRDIIYETQTFGQINSYTGEVKPVRQLFEIAKVDVSQGPGGSAQYSVQCYTKAIQQMKRDKKPGTIKGNGTQFIRNAAAKYGLEFYGEETSKAKKITKASGSKQSESLWDVMTNLANDAKFVLFEIDGILVFASEKFLLYKWGTDIRKVDRKITDPKKKTKKIIKESRRFIPLQFPNDGAGYIGKPGIFKLIERPSISKSSNDPYAAQGSCTVERANGTRIRPGMTAYVGNVPNMSGYYIVESVSFTEMSPDPVSVSFRTLTRDEEKEEIKLLPLGATYQQTSIFDTNSGLNFKTTVQSAKDKNGKIISKSSPDKRISKTNMPDENNQYRYPVMPHANISRTYPLDFKGLTKSTLDQNSLIITGNMSLWERPILPITNKSGVVIGADSINPIVKIETYGSSFRAVILPRIWTVDGQAVLVGKTEVISNYNSDGGYAGSAKHMGVLSGSTREKAKLNARDYIFLLKKQEALVLDKRFPQISDIENLTSTAGGADSVF